MTPRLAPHTARSPSIKSPVAAGSVIKLAQNGGKRWPETCFPEN